MTKINSVTTVVADVRPMQTKADTVVGRGIFCRFYSDVFMHEPCRSGSVWTRPYDGCVVPCDSISSTAIKSI